jgi:hypothetical protein
MKSRDWFNNTPAEPEVATVKQRALLVGAAEQVLDILEPQERVNVQIIGYGDWLRTLTKYEASRIIGVLKGNAVADDIRRRSEGEPPSKKWWATGLNDA